MSGAGPIVIKLGGAAVESPAGAGEVLRAMAGLCRAAPGRVVLVHGGGKAIDQHLSRLGIVSERREGLRVTGDAEIGEVVAVLAGRVNKTIVAALLAADVRAVGLSLGDGGLCAAERFAPGGVDLGWVGRVTGGDASLARALLAGGFVPVIAPCAFDEAGRMLNVNGDDAAAGVARVIGAELLVLLTDVAGVLDEQRRVIPRLDARGIDDLIARGVVTGGMVPKVRAALDAAQASGAATLIASWSDASVMGSLLTGAPKGTLVGVGVGVGVGAGEAPEAGLGEVGNAAAGRGAGIPGRGGQ